MPSLNTIGYQSEFLRVIPDLWVSCIRVTHPCAGRHQTKQALFMLPLDLHVLSLSLAFILSQDQTLHCTFYFFVCPNLKLYCSYLLTVVIFKFTLYLYYIFVVFNLSKNLFPFASKRTAKLRHFFELTKYFKKNIYFSFQ